MKLTLEIHTGKRGNQEMFLSSKKKKNCSKGPNISNNAWSNNHSVDFRNAAVIDKDDYHVCKTLESWHTAMTRDTENNFKPLPGQ